MFELITPTPALLKSVTPRKENHGEDLVVAISMRMEVTTPNTLLDLLSPRLRHALYQAVEGQEQLPGVEESTPLLRFNAFEMPHRLKACFEGWTLKVSHGIDEDDPITLCGAKIDELRIDAKEGGSVVLSFRAGTNDVSPEEIGLLCGKLGSEIAITLTAPEKQADVIDGTTDAFKRDHPDAADAGELFAAAHGGDGPDDPDDDGSDEDDEGGIDTEPDPAIMGGAKSFEEAVKAELAERTSARTERGRAKTQAALKSGATH
jgi:hypothetical protein